MPVVKKSVHGFRLRFFQADLRYRLAHSISKQPTNLLEAAAQSSGPKTLTNGTIGVCSSHPKDDSAYLSFQKTLWFILWVMDRVDKVEEVDGG
jgi:hypothetical protein